MCVRVCTRVRVCARAKRVPGGARRGWRLGCSCGKGGVKGRRSRQHGSGKRKRLVAETKGSKKRARLEGGKQRLLTVMLANKMGM